MVETCPTFSCRVAERAPDRSCSMGGLEYRENMHAAIQGEFFFFFCPVGADPDIAHFLPVDRSVLASVGLPLEDPC